MLRPPARPTPENGKERCTMSLGHSNQFASALATFARTKLGAVPRGAIVVKFLGDGALVAGVFGNDNYFTDDKARREVELVRRWERDAHVEHVGFGVSADGKSWAL